jgi:hypothetical protein
VRWAFGLAIVGAAYSAGLVGLLSLPGSRPVSTITWSLPFVGLFPVAWVAVRGAQKRWSSPVRASADDLAAAKRPTDAAVGVLTVLLAGAVLVMILTWPPMFMRPPGQPSIENGRYVLDNRGALTAISRDEYLRYAEDDQRGAISFALLFYLSSALAIAMLDFRRPSRK